MHRVLFVLSAVFALACSGGASPGSTAAPAASSGVQAAPAAGSIEKDLFRTVLPEGWEVLADDYDKMGLMTLGKRGTAGAHGVYIKLERNNKADPMQAIEKMAASQNGSPAEQVERHGIPWARTRFTYAGVTQSLNITRHGDHELTFTVMGEDYDDSPGVKAIFDGLVLL
ncbi:MAG: hypothetical protein H6737_23615 [Alphaproteobacteria bacterium]|nr:hypothetical protein [Alphaproteobacteria bacterium]